MQQALKRLRQPRVATLICILIFLCLPLALFWSVTIGPNTLLPADILFQFAPFHAQAATYGMTYPQNDLLADLILQNYQWKQFIVQSLQQGELPLWNPYLFAGVPFFAAGQHSALYPPSILYYVLPLAKAYGWYTVLNLWLAGAFMFAFMRTLGTGRIAALFAGIAYQLSGFLIVSAVHPMVIGAAAWLPLILAMCERIIQQAPGLNKRPASLPWAFIGAFAIGMQILAGHIEVTLYTALVVVAFCIWRIATVVGFGYLRTDGPFILKALGWLTLMGVGGALIAGVQLIPLFELVTQNYRGTRSDFAQVLSYGLRWRELLRWLHPDFFGNPAHHTYFSLFTFNFQPIASPQGHTAFDPNHYKNYVEGGAYVGIATLVFSGLAIFAKARRILKNDDAPVGFFIVLGIASILFVFGTPVYALLYFGLPGINQLHSPFRWLFPLTLCLSALAGIGFEWLWQQLRLDQSKFHRDKVVHPVRVLAFGLLALGGSLVMGVMGLRLIWPLVEARLTTAITNSTILNNAFGNAHTFFSYEANNSLHLALMLLTLGAILQLALRPTLYARWNILAVALLAFDLLWVWSGFNPSVNPALLDHKSEVIDYLQRQPHREQWRITTYTPSSQNASDRLLNANMGWAYGLQDIRGYDSIIPKPYVDYMSGIEPQSQLLYNRIAPLFERGSLESPLLDLLNVRYVLSEVPIDPPVQGLKQVFEAEGVRVYENTRAMPRAYTLPLTQTLVVPLSAFTATIQSTDPRQVVMVDPIALATARDVEAFASGMPSRMGLVQPQPANITVYKNNEIWVDVDVTEPSWLILNDSYFPGWRAFVKARGADDDTFIELPIARVNGNFRGVNLNPESLGLSLQGILLSTKDSGLSTLTVRFRYFPDSFRIGGIATLVGLIGLLFLGGVYVWRNVSQNGTVMGDSAVRRVAKNSLVLTGFSLVSRLLDFAFALLMARFLGVGGVGNYAFAVVIVSWFEILMNFGLNTFLIRDVSRDRQNAMGYLYGTSLLRLGLGALAAPLVAVVIIYFTQFNNMSRDTALTIVLLAISQIPSSLSTGLSALFFAYEKAEIPGALTIISALLKITIGSVLLFSGAGIIGLAITSLVVNLITLIILIIAARNTLPLHFQLHTSETRLPRASTVMNGRGMLRESFPLMLNHLLATLFFKVDVPLLKAIKNEAAVGYYSTAYKYIDAFNIIPSLFTQSLFPVMARQAKQSDNALARSYVLSLKLLVMVAFPLAVTVSFLASTMIGLFGADFQPGTSALIIMIWSIPVGWINSVTNYALIAAGQQRMLTRAFVIGLVFNIVANLVFIPWFSFQAAAVITILSEIVEGSAFYTAVRRSIVVVDWVDVLARPVLASGLMSLCVYLLANAGWIIPGLLLGGVVYLATLFVLRVFTVEERLMLAPLLPKFARAV